LVVPTVLLLLAALSLLSWEALQVVDGSESVGDLLLCVVDLSDGCKYKENY